MTEQEARSYKARFMSLNLISISMTVFSAILPIIAFVIISGEGEGDQTITMGLGAAALMTLVMSLFLPTFLLSRALKKYPYETRRGEEIFNAYFTSQIIGMAMKEGVAVIGFALAMISEQPIYSLLASSAAVVALVACWPSRWKFNKLLPAEKQLRD